MRIHTLGASEKYASLFFLGGGGFQSFIWEWNEDSCSTRVWMKKEGKDSAMMLKSTKGNIIRKTY